MLAISALCRACLFALPEERCACNAWSAHANDQKLLSDGAQRTGRGDRARSKRTRPLQVIVPGVADPERSGSPRRVGQQALSCRQIFGVCRSRRGRSLKPVTKARFRSWPLVQDIGVTVIFFDLVPSVLASAPLNAVAKRKSSVYESGRRSGAWVKYMLTKAQEFVIGGCCHEAHQRAGYLEELLQAPWPAVCVWRSAVLCVHLCPPRRADRRRNRPAGHLQSF